MIFRKSKSKRSAADAEAAESNVRPAPTKPGPYDADEVDLDVAHTGRVDLGGLQLPRLPDVEVRVQSDEASGRVQAVGLVSQESAMQLHAFAAPRSEGIWDEVRREVAADASRKGGVVNEQRGPHGVELLVGLPAKTADGKSGTQYNRIIGIDGPRWFLRATLIGRAARDQAAAIPLLRALAGVVVVRGGAPMAPKDPIPMTMANVRAPQAEHQHGQQPGQPGVSSAASAQQALRAQQPAQAQAQQPAQQPPQAHRPGRQPGHQAHQAAAQHQPMQPAPGPPQDWPPQDRPPQDRPPQDRPQAPPRPPAQPQPQPYQPYQSPLHPPLREQQPPQAPERHRRG